MKLFTIRNGAVFQEYELHQNNFVHDIHHARDEQLLLNVLFHERSFVVSIHGVLRK